MNYRNLLRPVEILLVDDNPGDVQLMMSALREAQVVKNALNTEPAAPSPAGPSQKAEAHPLPTSDLVLRDLNLPKNDGLEILTEIENDPHLRQMPVVIVTSSGARQVKNHPPRANCYLTQPLDLGQFICTINAVDNFWYTVVHLPTEEPDRIN
ncbi:MAG TPA: response regulator [Blastocatellia bacterium]|nr:response regulator [Blastocatellia bacterium]